MSLTSDFRIASQQAPSPPLLARSNHHRIDIQLLRALAVALVVLHHARTPYLPGGFLGVDIFFVISGFLMAGLIDQDLVRGAFKLSKFYMRRAKRLLPAAFVTLAVTAAAAQFLLDPLELRNFAWQVIGSVALVSNVVLWRQSFYFDSAAALKPLLHMWSLSLEEQFYLVLPVLLILLPRRAHLTACVLLTALSALACAYFLSRAPAPTFYLLPTRAWELGVGVCVALALRRGLIAPRRMLGARLLCFFALLATPALMTDEGHPGVAAAIVCLATAVLMIPGWAIGEVNAPVRWVAALGDRSYSIYLAHWPLIAFAENIYVTPVPGYVRALLVLAALVVGDLQYRFVEQPFQRRAALPLLQASMAALLLVACSGVSLFMAQRLATPSTVARANNVGLSVACDYGETFTAKPECQSGSSPHLLVWGDSIAMSIADGLNESVPGGIIQATRTVCGPILDLAPISWLYPRVWASSCDNFNNSVWNYVKDRQEITTVVLSSILKQYIPDADHLHWRALERRDGASVEHDADGAAVIERLSSTVRALQRAGKRVVLFAPPPSDDLDESRCLDRLAAGRVTIEGRHGCDVGLAEYHEARAPILAFLQKLRDLNVVPIVSTDGFLCDQLICRSSLDGVSLYRDPVHFSHAGSRRLGRAMNWDEIIGRDAR